MCAGAHPAARTLALVPADGCRRLRDERALRLDRHPVLMLAVGTPMGNDLGATRASRRHQIGAVIIARRVEQDRERQTIFVE